MTAFVRAIERNGFSQAARDLDLGEVDALAALIRALGEIDGRPYMAMELLTGQSLAEVVARVNHELCRDNERAVWLYRDYVVQSFNDNKPFDRFTEEQLAGDLLPGAGRDPVADASRARSR